MNAKWKLNEEMQGVTKKGYKVGKNLETSVTEE